jgi:hypothetical protein
MTGGLVFPPKLTHYLGARGAQIGGVSQCLALQVLDPSVEEHTLHYPLHGVLSFSYGFAILDLGVRRDRPSPMLDSSSLLCSVSVGLLLRPGRAGKVVSGVRSRPDRGTRCRGFPAGSWHPPESPLLHPRKSVFFQVHRSGRACHDQIKGPGPNGKEVVDRHHDRMTQRRSCLAKDGQGKEGSECSREPDR